MQNEGSNSITTATLGIFSPVFNMEYIGNTKICLIHLTASKCNVFHSISITSLEFELLGFLPSNSTK